MSKQEYQFQTEVSRLLNIVAKSLYSESEIFLRELISNASDACDKLRYNALTEKNLLAEGAELSIHLKTDIEKKCLIISDNGIGMNQEDLVNHLGTIARSGTSAFLDHLASEKQSGDVNLIGQFGVGFYSAFIVSDQVEVITKKAGEKEAWKWISNGQDQFTIEPAEKETQGTDIYLYLTDEHKEFVEQPRIEHIVKTYSDHIAVPILLAVGDEEPKQLNSASALWTRAKNEIKPDEYKEFYHHVAHAFDEPLLTMHNRVEGMIEYISLLFIPSSKPFDLFSQERKNNVKLYVNRVFITDDCKELLPTYLRFVKGVVDSSDLPLNLSRELLQNNAVVSKIRKSLTKKILQELQKMAKNDTEKFNQFWAEFGAVLKEGIYEDAENREQILSLSLFHSSQSGSDLISLATYIERMPEGQKFIYTVSGKEKEKLMHSPQMEAFLERKVEVLLFTDPVDEFWTGMVTEFKGKTFQSVTKGVADLPEAANDDQENKEAVSDDHLDRLIGHLKVTLGEYVKDVRVSNRLASSPVCLVADEQDVDIHLQRLLQQTQQQTIDVKRILEINPKHILIQNIAEKLDHKDVLFQDVAHLLLDEARLLEGESLPNPSEFARRLNQLVQKGLFAA